MTTEPENPADAIEETPEPTPAEEEALTDDTTRALQAAYAAWVRESVRERSSDRTAAAGGGEP